MVVLSLLLYTYQKLKKQTNQTKRRRRRRRRGSSATLPTPFPSEVTLVTNTPPTHHPLVSSPRLSRLVVVGVVLGGSSAPLERLTKTTLKHRPICSLQTEFEFLDTEIF